MKQYLHFLLLMASLGLYGRNIDNCGLDNNPALTDEEALFLNDYFDEERRGFDFRGKKILIVGGSAGLSLYGKADYFQSIKERLETTAMPIASAPYPFTADEKAKSGGYDAMLTFWVKVPVTAAKKARVARWVGEGMWEVPGCD